VVSTRAPCTRTRSACPPPLSLGVAVCVCARMQVEQRTFERIPGDVGAILGLVRSSDAKVEAVLHAPASFV